MSETLWPFGLLPARLLCPWDFQAKILEWVAIFLLQGIFPTQGLNPCVLDVLHCRQILYPLSHQGSSQTSVYILRKKNSEHLLDFVRNMTSWRQNSETNQLRWSTYRSCRSETQVNGLSSFLWYMHITIILKPWLTIVFIVIKGEESWLEFWILVSQPIPVWFHLIILSHPTITEIQKEASGDGYIGYKQAHHAHVLVSSGFQSSIWGNDRILCGKVKSLSRVRLFVTPWTVAYQVPLSMGFSRQ